MGLTPDFNVGIKKIPVNSFLLKNTIFFSVFVILPLVCGSLIYIFFREYKPLIFNILLSYIPVTLESKPAQFLGDQIGFLFVYNLPDGLWAFSLTSFLYICSVDNFYKNRFAYVLLSFFIIIAQEVLQGTLLPGTYDPLDLIFVVAGFMLSSIFFCKGLAHG